MPGSRADRSLWAIEESSIEYEHIKTKFVDESRTQEYLKINPNGRLPALVDGALTLFESKAIKLYLTQNYAQELYPTNIADEARANQ